jgi:hypothetical protein
MIIWKEPNLATLDFFLLVALLYLPQILYPQNNKKAAAKPLFRDPVCDGAADPTVIWNRKEKNGLCFIQTAGPM